MTFSFLVLRRKPLNSPIMNLLQITSSQISQLAELRLNLNHLAYLLQMQEGTSLVHTPTEQALLRKNLISEGSITEEGKSLIEAVKNNTEQSVKSIIKKVDVNSFLENFESWWETFPRNGNFEYKGRKFQLGRPLRVGKKSEVQDKYIKILVSGKYTHEQLLNALKCEIIQRKKDTFKKGINQFQYMKGAASYLNQEAYEAFIGEEVEDVETNNVVDGAFNL